MRDFDKRLQASRRRFDLLSRAIVTFIVVVAIAMIGGYGYLAYKAVTDGPEVIGHLIGRVVSAYKQEQRQ